MSNLHALMGFKHSCSVDIKSELSRRVHLFLKSRIKPLVQVWLLMLKVGEKGCSAQCWIQEEWGKIAPVLLEIAWVVLRRGSGRVLKRRLLSLSSRRYTVITNL